ncbi:MAG: DMT family transporter [Acidimicrobiia bacterium]|nr:DMT family transporter [Acidimicrobiia bacterium]MDH5421122.1 DMT family transporter [Acidimicrobiia bacterium]MDH5503893.1 DMT family transporter [Acidimicrobiia bacterium]
MHSRSVAALGAASLGWGLAGVGVRALFIAGTSTFTVVVFRILFATMAVVVYGFALRTNIDGEAWRRGSVIGLLRIGIAPMLFIGSLNYISAGFESLVITLIPVVTAVLARVFLSEMVRRSQVVGLMLGVAGTLVIVASGDSGLAEGGNALAGAGLAFGGVLAGSLSGVISRRFAPLHTTAELAIPMFVSGLVLVSFVGLGIGGVRPATVPMNYWPLLVALGLGSTLLPFVATLYATKHVSATVVALTGYLAPLVGLVGGVVLLGELITPSIAVGGLLTLTGVLVVGTPRRKLGTGVT